MAPLLMLIDSSKKGKELLKENPKINLAEKKRLEMSSSGI
jgi:hypothetical protein